MATAERKQRLKASNMAKQFGFALAKAEPGRVLLRRCADERHKQIHGVVHGSVLTSLTDTASGLTMYKACPRGTRVATVKIRYLEAVEEGDVAAETRVVRRGRHIATADCDLHGNARPLNGKVLRAFFVPPSGRSRERLHR